MDSTAVVSGGPNDNRIHASVTGCANGKIGKFTVIDQNTVIGRKCDIAEQNYIEAGCKLGDEVSIRNLTRIYRNSKIGNKCNFDEHVVVSRGATIGNGVSIGQWTEVAPNVRIGDNCFIEDYCVIDAGLSNNVYVGKFVTVYSNATIAESTIIHKYVSMTNTFTHQARDVIIRAPTTKELLDKAEPFANLNASQ